MSDEHSSASAGKSEIFRTLSSFISNIYSLRVFCSQIAEHADRHDQEVVEGFVKKLGELAEVNPEDIEITDTALKVVLRLRPTATQDGSEDEPEGADLGSQTEVVGQGPIDTSVRFGSKLLLKEFS